MSKKINISQYNPVNKIGRKYLPKDKALHRIQKDLKPNQRLFSKFIHINGVEKISNGAAKTIAQPYGLLFGGLASFLSSIVVLTICRYYGYEYNFFIGIVSFIGGFFVGIICQLFMQILKKPD